MTISLEKIRLSIPRLKLGMRASIERYLAQQEPWKDKTLDYEIETGRYAPYTGAYEIRLEKIRFSITRLKHDTVLKSWERVSPLKR